MRAASWRSRAQARSAQAAGVSVCSLTWLLYEHLHIKYAQRACDGILLTRERRLTVIRVMALRRTCSGGTCDTASVSCRPTHGV